MKLDLVEINKLSPPSLWDLGVLSALISTLLGVIEARIGGTQSVHFYGRMLVRLSSDLRAKTRENFRMRIKAWVLQCPECTLWVRGLIGEAAIKRWRKNRMVDYALTKYFGDWQRKWPKGFKSPDKKHNSICTRKYKYKMRAYNWKLFALTKIINVERFLYGQARPDLKADEMHDELRAAYYKLWGVDILDTQAQTQKWSQPRERRSLKPVAFTPYELDVVEDVREEDGECTEKNIGTVKRVGVNKPHAPPILKTERKFDHKDITEDKPP